MKTIFTNSLDSIVISKRIIYTPSKFARTTLLFLQEIGSLEANKGHTSKRSNLNSYLFFRVQSGSGVLVYGGIEHQIIAGDCVFINCSIPYSHSTDSNDLWSLQWIHFNGDIMPAIYNKYISRGGQPVFHPSDIEPFSKLFDSLFDIASSNDYIRDMSINAELSYLLMLLMRESWNPDNVEGEKRSRDLLQIKMYLDEHYMDKILLDELADMFYINKFYMVKRFKVQYGLSLNSYLQEVRITHAKQLLRFTDKKVENIGLECGLGELSYFSRTFKKAEGISPREYRSKWNGEKD